MKKIMVVDDEPAIVELLRAELVSNKFKVVSACGGKECLDKIKAEKPDLVILDVAMPDLDGSEVAKKIRLNPQFAKLPIIFLTGLLSKNDEAVTGNVIANEVIFAKPLSLQRLTEKVKEILAGVAA